MDANGKPVLLHVKLTNGKPIFLHVKLTKHQPSSVSSIMIDSRKYGIRQRTYKRRFLANFHRSVKFTSDRTNQMFRARVNIVTCAM